MQLLIGIATAYCCLLPAAYCLLPTAYFLLVPDRRYRIHLEVILVRLWGVWVLGIWKGRVWGKGGSGEVSLQATWDRGGQILSQLGGFQVSRRGPKRGNKGESARGDEKQGECAMYIVIYVHVYKRMAEASEWYQLYICIIIIIGMNVGDNLNSV
jgi:hypothetical protein